MGRKLIGVPVATLVCLVAVPWIGTGLAATSAALATSTLAGRIHMAEARLDGVSVDALRLALGAVQCATATGDNIATRFSDEMNSHQTSLGLFVTRDAYVGTNGYSLRLDGLEPGFNGRARERAIVIHGAPYVDAELGASQGRIGRSWGCPALREGIARQVIDMIRGGGVIFSYYPDGTWLKASRFLNGYGATT